MALTAKTVRLALNKLATTETPDVLTAARPIFWRGATAAIQCALFDGVPSGTTYMSDISSIVSVELIVRKHNARGTVLIDQVIPASGIIASSYANWIAGTGQQFSFVLDEAYLSWDVLASGSLPIYFTVTVTTATSFYTAGFGYGQIVDVGIVDVVAPNLPTSFVSLAPAANGSVDVTLVRGIAAINLIAVAGSSGPYTYNLSLPVANILTGSLVDLAITIPASINPTITVRNASSTGTLLHSVSGDSSNIIYQSVVFRFDGNVWIKFGPAET